MKEELMKFFHDNDFQNPWWACKDSTILGIVVDADNPDLSEEDDVQVEGNVGDCGEDGNCSGVEPAKPNKKSKNVFLKIIGFILSLFNTKLDIRKRTVDDSYPDIPTTPISGLNSISLSVRPSDNENRKMADACTFFMFVRNLMFLDRQVDVDFPEKAVHEVYKRALILDRDNGKLNVSHPSVESLVSAANEYDVLSVTTSTCPSVDELKRELQRRQIALVQLKDDSLNIVYGFKDDSWYVFDGELFVKIENIESKLQRVVIVK